MIAVFSSSLPGSVGSTVTWQNSWDPSNGSGNSLGVSFSWFIRPRTLVCSPRFETRLGSASIPTSRPGPSVVFPIESPVPHVPPVCQRMMRERIVSPPPFFLFPLSFFLSLTSWCWLSYLVAATSRGHECRTPITYRYLEVDAIDHFPGSIFLDLNRKTRWYAVLTTDVCVACIATVLHGPSVGRRETEKKPCGASLRTKAQPRWKGHARQFLGGILWIPVPPRHALPTTWTTAFFPFRVSSHASLLHESSLVSHASLGLGGSHDQWKPSSNRNHSRKRETIVRDEQWEAAWLRWNADHAASKHSSMSSFLFGWNMGNASSNQPRSYHPSKTKVLVMVPCHPIQLSTRTSTDVVDLLFGGWGTETSNDRCCK